MPENFYAHVPGDPRTTQRHPQIHSPRPGPGFQCILVGGIIWEHQEHYVREGKGRTFPCYGTECVYCDYMGKRPTGYACAVRPRTLARIVLQLSEGALKQLDILARKQPVCGLMIETRRAGARTNSKQIVSGQGIYDGGCGPLPDPWDVRPSLHQMWGSDMARRVQARLAGGRQVEEYEAYGEEVNEL